MKLTAIMVPYLRLIRIPNGFTAIADSWAGYIIHTGMDGVSYVTLIYLALASFCLYSAGIILNDLHDQPVDSQCNPNRPLPSGVINRTQAIALMTFLMTIAGVVCFALGLIPLIIGFFLGISIFMYDIVFKKSRSAPLWMGACRMFNMMLGMSAATVRFYAHPYIIIPILLLVYVLLLSLAATRENDRRKGSFFCFGLILWIILTYGLSYFFEMVTKNIGSFYLGVWIVIGGFIFIYQRLNDSVKAYRMMIVFFIFSIPAVDAIFTAGILGNGAGLLILASLIPTIILAPYFSAH